MSKDVNDNVSKGTKKAGRPRRFDETAALEAAMEVFWAKGFEGASLDDLTSAMGINRPSLYGAFGDKNALFRKAVDHYGTTIGGRAVESFLAEPNIQKAVAAYFEAALEGQCRPGECARGCLIAGISGMAADKLPELRAQLTEFSTTTHQKIVDRFEAEIAQQNLPAGPNAKFRAILMADLMQAQAFRARNGETKHNLHQQITMRVQAVINAP